jgi:hypothetical protein
MLACGRWLVLIAVLLATAPDVAAAQGPNAFDGTYVGVSAWNLGSMQRGSTSGGCRTFNAPSPPTIVNGRIQGKWGDGTFDGQVDPDGTVRMKTQPFAGIFEGRIANQTITGRYQGGCNYDLSWGDNPASRLR